MKFKYIFIISALIVFFNATPSQAACYNSAEAEAEQGIRIHSELMVIGLNCMHLPQLSGGQNVYLKYKQMTQNYGDLFAGYEQTLMSHFKKEGKNAEREMNLMRTQFANKISNDAAGMRPDVFCLNHVPRIQQATAMSRQQFRKWAATPYASHPVSRPMCGG